MVGAQEVIVNSTTTVIIAINPKIINKKLEKQRSEKTFHSKRSLQAYTLQNTQAIPPSYSENNVYLSLLQNLYQWDYLRMNLPLNWNVSAAKSGKFYSSWAESSFSWCLAKIGINKLRMNEKLSKKKIFLRRNLSHKLIWRYTTKWVYNASLNVTSK